MKKNTILIILALILSSCQDDILEKVPKNIITDAAVWEDVALVDAFLTLQYSLTTVMVNESGSYVGSWSDASPIDGQWDIYNSEQGAGFLTINQITDESRAGWEIVGTSGLKAGGLNVGGGLLEWWEYPYYIIRNLNQFIERVPASSLDGEFAEQRVSEARFLRAFNYFAMVKRYGGVPLITKELKLDDPEDALYPARNSEQEIYDFIISELDDIQARLPSTPTYGRPCKWAALALKSRAALYAGSIAQFGSVQLDGLLGIPAGEANNYYQKAYEAANEIITSAIYRLYDEDDDKVVNFKNIFLKKRNSEVIFAKQHNYVDALGGGGATWSYDFVQRPKPHAWNLGMGNCPYLEMAEEFEYVDGTSGKLDRNSIQQGLWSMEELWGNKDPRFFATLYTMETPWKGGYVDFHKGLIDPSGNLLENTQDAYNGVAAWGNQDISGNFFTGFGVMKYLEESLDIGATWSNSGTDYIVFRFGEILLNFAEAAYELGRPGEALSAVNQIRSRAGIASLPSISREEIRHERKVELAFEGHRYWDLRRWRTAVADLTRSFSGLQYILDYETRKYRLKVLEHIDGSNGAARFFEKNYYLPISLRRTGANSNLVENTGY